MTEAEPGRNRMLLLMQTRSACEAVAAVLAEHFPARPIRTATHPEHILEELRSNPRGILIVAEGAVETGTLHFLRDVYEIAPEVEIVLMGVPPDPDRAVAILEAGAHALVGKDAPLEDLLAGIRAVADEEVSVSPDVAWLLAARVRALSSILRGTELDSTLLQDLTPREREILDHLEKGHDNRSIGHDLGITTGTVKSHVHSILAKLGVRTRAGAAEYLRDVSELNEV